MSFEDKFIEIGSNCEELEAQLEEALSDVEFYKAVSKYFYSSVFNDRRENARLSSDYDILHAISSQLFLFLNYKEDFKINQIKIEEILKELKPID